MSRLNELYKQAVASLFPEGPPAEITHEDITTVAENWSQLVIADENSVDLVGSILRHLVEQRLVREPSRTAEQAGRDDQGESNRGSGKHKRPPRVPQVSFLDTAVKLRSWPEPVLWGNMDLGQVKEVFEDRQSRYESLRHAKDFAQAQLTLMETTQAPTLREAYRLGSKRAPTTAPDAD